MKAIIVLFLSTALFLVGPVPATAGVPPPHRVPRTVTGTPQLSYLNINNISTVVKGNGITDIDAIESNGGFVFPKGSFKTAVFQSGLLWGGIDSGAVRVGGSAYRTGLQPGRILPDGTPDNPDLPQYRVYRVRRDVSPYEQGADTLDDFSAEMLDEGTSWQTIRAQYRTDWNEWPAADGAPYEDVDGDGTYTPATDIPGFPGADQTIWFVCNDLNAVLTGSLYGSSPIGIELQVTAWAYNRAGGLGNTIFRKYLLINRSNAVIDSMYVSQFSDIDIGTSTDDFAGSDSAVASRMGYIYNATTTDAVYAPLPPPVVGFIYLQGPTIPSPGDTAMFRGRLVPGLKNLPATSMAYLARGSAEVTDPVMGSYDGTTQWYNFFRGRVGLTGVPFTDPDGTATPFALSGNPVTLTGWRDGQDLPAGDRRIALSSGPFTMAPADTQEIVVAEMAAGAFAGADHITSISLLRFTEKQVQDAFRALFPSPSTGVTDVPALPGSYALAQNYPNPFNPATHLAFALPGDAHVTLRVYDVLGRVVATLVDGVERAGVQGVTFDANALPSGVYFYQLQAGRFTDTKKMLLMR